MTTFTSSTPPEDRILILGSSPSMPRYSAHAFESCGKVFTTNAGVYECMFRERPPDVYAVIEIDTPKLFGRYYRKYHKRGETKILTIDLTIVNEPSLADEADIVLQIVPGKTTAENLKRRQGYYSDQTPYKRGKYVGCAASGGYLLQYAMNEHAPKEVWLIGMEGYRSTPGTRAVDTFDGRLGNESGQKWTRDLYSPLIRQVVAAWPETRFVFFGKLTYPISGENVRLVYRKPVEEEQS